MRMRRRAGDGSCLLFFCYHLQQTAKFVRNRNSIKYLKFDSMTRLIPFLLLILVGSFVACDDGDTTYSYSFDVRSCNGDLFSETVSEEGSTEEREVQMKAWLSTQEIEATEVELRLDFLQGVCEACVICPTGDRYFITTSAEVSGKQVGILNFLNWVEE